MDFQDGNLRNSSFNLSSFVEERMKLVQFRPLKVRNRI